MKKKDWEAPVVEERKMTKYYWLARGVDNLTLGKYTDIGGFTLLIAKAGLEIKDYVQIGSHCVIYTVNTEDNTRGKVTLEENCRIGTHSSIMPGVSVGENSVVGAYSFVKENTVIGKNELWLGVPAKFKRKLTEEEVDNMLREIGKK